MDIWLLLDNKSMKTEYWTMAHKAIKEGLLTMEEARTIARVGTRKQEFWTRHVRDLESYLEMKRGKTK
jgi:hypothetical protein